MQHGSVEKLFKQQVGQYARHDAAIESSLLPFIKEWIKKKKYKKKITVCEFGGGVGHLLFAVHQLYPASELVNVEIIDDYKKFLVSKKIHYVKGSLLGCEFANNSFDIVIIRDVLHHLVGSTYTQTSHNQRFALRELKRVTKPGGAIFIEELTNQSKILTQMIYYFCKVNAKTGIRIPSLDISPDTIVAFLTPKSFLNLCFKAFEKKHLVSKKIITFPITKWQLKLLYLGARVEKAVVAFEK